MTRCKGSGVAQEIKGEAVRPVGYCNNTGLLTMSLKDVAVRLQRWVGPKKMKPKNLVRMRELNGRARGKITEVPT